MIENTTSVPTSMDCLRQLLEAALMMAVSEAAAPAEPVVTGEKGRPGFSITRPATHRRTAVQLRDTIFEALALLMPEGDDFDRVLAYVRTPFQP